MQLKHKTILGAGLFLFSGIVSIYLYLLLSKSGGGIFPGLFYTSATVALFLVFNKKLSLVNLMAYYVLMNILYVILYFATFYSATLGFLVGIFTAGIGAIVSFILANRFITPIEFSKVKVFCIGASAFIVTDIFHFSLIYFFDRAFTEIAFGIEQAPSTLFCEVFLFWHLFVGVKLILTLRG
jgi:hypothetical protein